MTDDLYQRPDRDAIAARVRAAESAKTTVDGIVDDLGDAVTRDEPDASDVLPCFATHLRARLRALGWTQGELEERAGTSAPTAARALKATGVSLDIAARLAVLVGSTLVTMIGPYTCGTCQGSPYPGYRCLECGAEGERQ